MTNMRSARRGMKCASENAFFGPGLRSPLPSSSGYGTKTLCCWSVISLALSVSGYCGMYMEADSATISFKRRSNNSAPFFTESSESAESYHTNQCQRNIGRHATHFAKSIKYEVEIHQNFTFGDFGDVV